MIDKVYCMSSYLAFRYLEDENKNFYAGMRHKHFVPIPDEQKILCRNAKDIDSAIGEQFRTLKRDKLGLMLSGGMDSAILASYMQGCDAYTFRFMEGEFQKEELKRAEQYARRYNLKLHYVDVNWDIVSDSIDKIMDAKSAPVHSIEPQILCAAEHAQRDGITKMVVGESSDLIFGGMDGLLSKDWTVEEFEKRYTFTSPESVLKEYQSMSYLFEKYRIGTKIDLLRFMDDIFSIESSGSYFNAFGVAQMPYYDPYAKLKMAEPLDLDRVRNGEPKYLIRELFSMKYPDIPIPNKIPMPRPVDYYFADWKGPVRKEFRDDIDISKYTGNQKWQMWCLERFLNNYDK